MGQKTLQNVIASTRTCLSLWNDKEICRTTATNSLDFELLRDPERPTAIFVCNPLKDLIYLKPLSCLFFQGLFDFILSKVPDEKEDVRSVFFVIDESGSMRFPNLHITASNIRKYKSGILLCMQDEMALLQYGQAESHQISTNMGCKIYLPGSPPHVCKNLSEILGKTTVFDDRSQTEKTLDLLSPSQVRMCPEAIILINNAAPLRCKTIPFHKKWWLGHISKLPVLKISKTVSIDPPLLPFN